jgi:hypothetical protein
MQDLIADQIDLLFQGLYSLPLARLGSIKAYAVTGDTRSVPAWPVRTGHGHGVATATNNPLKARISTQIGVPPGVELGGPRA